MKTLTDMIKKCLCIAISVSFAQLPEAQILVSNTFAGGTNNAGTIGKYSGDTKQLTVLESLGGPGTAPACGLTQANDGKLYGMTVTGGVNNFGGIFSFDPASGTYTDLKSLADLDGRYPTGSLLQASDGRLYGTTNGGSGDNNGILFSFDPASSTCTKLFDFSYTSGVHPYGSLIQAMDGKLYGMTYNGGMRDNPGGVIFSYDLATDTYTDVVDLNTDFGFPKGNLVQTADGKFYGMASPGIASTERIFVYDPASGEVTSVHDFDATEDEDGNLTLAPDGKLYGVATAGGSEHGGFLFCFDPSASIYSRLADFDSAVGMFPIGALMNGKDGRLYGMTKGGGSNNNGTVFSFDRNSKKLQKLVDFGSQPGSFPLGNLEQASDGLIYGVTGGEGKDNRGKIFSLDLSTLTFSFLKTFPLDQSAINASGCLLPYTDGKLYGISTYGGTAQGGVIYSYDDHANTYTELKNLDFENGDRSFGSLVQWNDKKLYGMTTYGGVYYDLFQDEGTLFSFDPANGNYSRLFTFNSYVGNTGSNPYGSLLRASDGKFYGLTSWGGNGYRGGGTGVLFSFDPGTSTYDRLFDFGDLPFDFSPVNDSNGIFPYGNLIEAGNGKLYGMTSEGGTSHFGVIFSYDLTSGSYTKLFEFDSTNGSHPYGSLIQARDKKLYGMTYGGGSADGGIIFSFDLTSSVFTKLHDFNFTDGSHPYGNLMQASDGKLYGMTNSGGANDDGVAFSYDLVSSVFTKLVDYDQTNGANPYFGSAFIELPEPALRPISLLSFDGLNLGTINRLQWKVANENVDHYELERSVDGTTFDPIAHITADHSSIYQYDDDLRSLAGDKFFYRLRMVDFDGKFTLSNVIKLTVNKQDLIISVGPNPFSSQTTATIRSLSNQKANLKIASFTGVQLYTIRLDLLPGNNTIQLKEFNNLPAGTYVVTVASASNRRTISVVKGN